MSDSKISISGLNYFPITAMIYADGRGAAKGRQTNL